MALTKFTGGAKKTSVGEGAGCADFAMEFFKIATGVSAPYKWSARVFIPHSLIGSKDHPVSFLYLLARDFWAVKDEAATYFKIPDSNRVSRWLAKNGKLCGQHFLWSEHLFSGITSHHSCDELKKIMSANIDSLPPTKLENFEFKYSSSIPTHRIWNSIKK
jgi:hypothetical protein